MAKNKELKISQNDTFDDIICEAVQDMKKAVLEGLLFVVGEEGLTLDQIEDVLKIEESEAKELLFELKHDYEDESRGLRIDFL